MADDAEDALIEHGRALNREASVLLALKPWIESIQVEEKDAPVRACYQRPRRV